MTIFTHVRVFNGLSTDTKPSASLFVGDEYIETDTKKLYVWDGEDWVLLKDLSE